MRRLLGSSRWRQPAVAARRAPRPAGDADQRLERIGRRCVPVLLPPGWPGPADRTRTWGGLIGISGAPPLVDGGNVTVPTFRMYDPKGEWFAEGHGVEPDIKVDEDPSRLAKGTDPQLERAIKEVMDRVSSTRHRPRVRRTKYAFRRGLEVGAGTRTCRVSEACQRFVVRTSASLGSRPSPCVQHGTYCGPCSQ